MLLVPLQISIPEAFFREETRNDFTISEKMKKVWAVEMDLMAEFDRVCKKYGLRWYADSGTLIGAVRHHGFIPWDDDIDIVMLREDYDRLVSVAESEFQSPYFFQCAYTDPGFYRGYARLRNSRTTAIGASDLRNGSNKGIFIDVFCVDYLPDDPSERSRWIGKIKRLYSLLYIHYEKDHIKETKKRGFLYRAARNCVRSALSVYGFDRLFRKYDALCKAYAGTKGKNVSYVAYSRGKAKHIWKAESFESVEMMPFEFTQIPVPTGFDDRLRTEYGDYMVIRHSATTHGGLILEPEIPYEEYLQQHTRQEIEETFRTMMQGE